MKMYNDVISMKMVLYTCDSCDIIQMKVYTFSMQDYHIRKYIHMGWYVFTSLFVGRREHIKGKDERKAI